MNKNLSPKQISGAAAALVAGFTLVFVILLSPTLTKISQVLYLLVLFVLVLGVSFFIFVELVNYFVDRRIKLIYKVINTIKSPKGLPQDINYDNKAMENVENQVSEWAKERAAEFETMDKMEKFRREFFGNVNHELKTPIFNIQGYLYTLIDGAMDDPAIRDKYLQKAADNVERLASIVNDLTTITRYDGIGKDLDKQEFNIVDLVQEVFEELSLIAGQKGISLGFKKGLSREFPVIADRETIRQVLVNLIVNSVKYGREFGKTRIGFYDMGDKVLIEVSDNGPGIAEEHIPRLFERFYRVDKGRSRDEGGTGLGLSIVKHIVEAHGQSVNVRSKLGLGSTFGFTLDKPKLAVGERLGLFF